MEKFHITLAAAALFLTGCAGNTAHFTASAAGKNLDLTGWMMLGTAEAFDSTNAAPAGKIIVGRVNYKSRRVAIPADHKVPNTGSFRATTTESLLGTRETIIEYDFTAGSAEDAAAISEKLESQKKSAEKILQTVR